MTVQGISHSSGIVAGTNHPELHVTSLVVVESRAKAPWPHGPHLWRIPTDLRIDGNGEG